MELDLAPYLVLFRLQLRGARFAKEQGLRMTLDNHSKMRRRRCRRGVGRKVIKEVVTAAAAPTAAIVVVPRALVDAPCW